MSGPWRDVSHTDTRARMQLSVVVGYLRRHGFPITESKLRNAVDKDQVRTGTTASGSPYITVGQINKAIKKSAPWVIQTAKNVVVPEGSITAKMAKEQYGVDYAVTLGLIESGRLHVVYDDEVCVEYFSESGFLLVAKDHLPREEKAEEITPPQPPTPEPKKVSPKPKAEVKAKAPAKPKAKTAPPSPKKKVKLGDRCGSKGKSALLSILETVTCLREHGLDIDEDEIYSRLRSGEIPASTPRADQDHQYRIARSVVENLVKNPLPGWERIAPADDKPKGGSAVTKPRGLSITKSAEKHGLVRNRLFRLAEEGIIPSNDNGVTGGGRRVSVLDKDVKEALRNATLKAFLKGEKGFDIRDAWESVTNPKSADVEDLQPEAAQTPVVQPVRATAKSGGNEVYAAIVAHTLLETARNTGAPLDTLYRKCLGADLSDDEINMEMGRATAAMAQHEPLLAENGILDLFK